MPRVSKEQAALNRAAVVEAAAQLFKEHGINGISLADVAAQAGLTHGGFYGQFASKDALAAEALLHALSQAAARWQRTLDKAEDREAGARAVLDRYLSNQHRDNAGGGCLLPALAVDVARSADDSPLRPAFAQALEELSGLLTTDEESAQAAMARLSLAVGAMVLARATKGTGVSAQVLEAARKGMGALQ